MGWKFKQYSERPKTKIVLKDVTLSDGRVLKSFPVEVADPPVDELADNKAQPSATDEYGRVPRRGSGG
jgi:hypothetical protein